MVVAAVRRQRGRLEPSMLVLSRQRDQSIMIGDNIEVIIVGVRGDRVRIGITAPKDLNVHRKEVFEAIRRENESASRLTVDDLTGEDFLDRQANVTVRASTG